MSRLARRLQSAVQPASPTLPETVVSVSDVTDNSAVLHWTAVAGATGYLVGRDGTDSNGNGPYQTTDPVSATSREFIDLLPATTYTLYCQPQPNGVRKSISITTSAAPSGSERPSGPGYVRYEDVYVTGDDLQATIDRVPADADGNMQVLTFPEGEFIIPPNFANGYYEGVRLGHPSWGPNCRGLAGSGPGTIFKMLSDNHTKLAQDGSANPFKLIGVTPPSSAPIQAEMRNFKIEGTVLGANSDLDYGGLAMNYCHDSLVDNVLVTGVTGSANTPPGESGGISSYYCDNLTISNCEIDGRRDGVPVSATGLLMNRSTNTTVTNYYGHDNFCAMGGGSWWHCDYITVKDSVVEQTSVAGQHGYCWNHEESDHMRYENCTTNHGTAGGGMHYSLNSIGTAGPPEVPVDPDLTIIDPVWDALPSGNGQLVVQTWGGYGDNQHATKPATVEQADGTPIAYCWLNPFGVDQWQNQ